MLICEGGLPPPSTPRANTNIYMNKIFKIVIQFKKLDQIIQRKLGQNPT